MSLGGLVGYRGDSEISDSEDERSPHGNQPPGVGKRHCAPACHGPSCPIRITV